MKALVDKIEEEFDSEGYLIGKEFSGCLGQPVAWHRLTVGGHRCFRENRKVIGSGHVYIMNYNPETYIPTHPETFDEYLQSKNK